MEPTKKEATEEETIDPDEMKKASLEDPAKEESSPFEDQTKQLVEEESDQPVKSTLGEAAGLQNLVDENELLVKNITWEDLGVRKELIEGLLEMGFIKPSKIQATTFPLVMKNPPSHLVAQAHNGSGKTAAFGLGVLSRIDENEDTIQAVIFAHTRELVNQIAGVLSRMAKNTAIKVTSILTTSKGVDPGHVVICTPGHFDMCFFKKKLYDLSKIKIFVLDEADYMITQEITKLVTEKVFEYFHKNNLQVQVLFFSATFTEDNFKTIKKYYKKAHMLEIKKESLTLKNVRQMYFQVKKREDKVDFVEEYLKRNIEQERVIIFVNTRDFTVKLQKKLGSKGYKVFIIMGGDMNPEERDETIKKFNKGEIQILITTNVLARGFDEKLVKLIINFDLPIIKIAGEYYPDTQTYLHRIGRTGRFGSKGIGLTLISDENELKKLKEIEEYYQSSIEEITSLDDLITEFKKILYEKF